MYTMFFRNNWRIFKVIIKCSDSLREGCCAEEEECWPSAVRQLREKSCPGKMLSRKVSFRMDRHMYIRTLIFIGSFVPRIKKNNSFIIITYAFVCWFLRRAKLLAERESSQITPTLPRTHRHPVAAARAAAVEARSLQAPPAAGPWLASPRAQPTLWPRLAGNA